MADSLKILAQTSPLSNTLTNLYVVPSGKSCSVSSITVCNAGTAAAKFRISAAPAGAANTQSQYLYWDQDLDANSTFVITIGISLTATDIIRVQSNNALTSFNIFGVEV
jgi:hypothetical protein